MAWEGFLKESKKYMDYPCNDRGRFAEWNAYPYAPNGWTDHERRLAKIKFWLGFPRASIRFWFFTARDFIRKIYNQCIQRIAKSHAR
jgi:hypothetical protein